jgi:hypothetical protein
LRQAARADEKGKQRTSEKKWNAQISVGEQGDTTWRRRRPDGKIILKYIFSKYGGRFRN